MRRRQQAQKKKKRRPRILLVDGNNIVARMAHGYSDVRLPNGTPCGALYGTVDFLRNMMVRFPQDSIIVAYDSRVPRFRQRLVPTYKMRRHEERRRDPEKRAFYKELLSQLDLLPRILMPLGVHFAKCRNYEADDVIGALALRRYAHCNVMIFSEDKDFIQLVGPHCRQYRSCVNMLVTERPPAYVLSRAIEGDPSDCIRGVPSVGPVRAGKMLGECGTENVNEFFRLLSRSNRYERLVLEHEETVRNNYKAMDLRRTAKRVNRLLRVRRGEFNRNAFMEACREYHFRKFLAAARYYCIPFERAGRLLKGRRET